VEDAAAPGGVYHVDLAVVDGQQIGWLEGEYQDVQLE
jgi:hypothetical protein